MLKQLLSLYNIIEQNKQKLKDSGLSENFFIDIYRSQPQEPELYEYFSLPALFIDYSMTGQGKNQPRLITLTIHIVVDEMPDASNISEQKQAGLQRFTYCLLLQSILEGCRLDKSTPLRFVSENIIDEPVINYHSQTYEFEAYLEDMTTDIQTIIGQFEQLNIYGNLIGME
ncbi:MAG: hypothetical protein LBB85_11555 [Dysgonamonadaceae bacterium]|jgi:hypothetical protein|nr:hypothetical protein [Dysgonamonadaceae bacterium]